MPKRFTDTEKWKKPFIRGLAAEYKLLWFYILDDCDMAGIWQVDMEVAEIRLGVKLSVERAQGLLKDKVVVLDNGTKWFIPDFITFQYGALSEKNKMYGPVTTVLKKYNLMGHISSINGGKVKDKVKDKDKDKDIVPEFSAEDQQAFKSFSDWIDKFAPTVARMTEPFTIEQFIKVRAGIKNDLVKDLLVKMHNRKNLLKDNRSAYLTLLSWSKNEWNNPQPHNGIQFPTAPTVQKDARTLLNEE